MLTANSIDLQLAWEYTLTIYNNSNLLLNDNFVFTTEMPKERIPPNSLTRIRLFKQNTHLHSRPLFYISLLVQASV